MPENPADKSKELPAQRENPAEQSEEPPGERDDTDNSLRKTHLLMEYSGPLPPAQQFAAYEEVLPGAADRILRMAEGEGERRHERERLHTEATRAIHEKGINHVTYRHVLSLVAVVTIVGGALVAGTILIMNDKEAAGLATILTPIATILAGVMAHLYLTRKEDR